MQLSVESLQLLLRCQNVIAGGIGKAGLAHSLSCDRFRRDCLVLLVLPGLKRQ